MSADHDDLTAAGEMSRDELESTASILRGARDERSGRYADDRFGRL